MMELAPRIEMIQTSFGVRPLNMILLRGKDVVLVDTGVVGTPSDSVIPYLRSAGLTPRDLSLIIVTHAHADHFGGNEELWRASDKKTRFAAHRLDQRWIEDPPAHTRQWAQHYVDLGPMSDTELENAIQSSGNGVKIDQVLEGGEVLDLGDGLELEVIFAPGHTPGNICLLERRNKILVQGETICGVAQYSVEGKLLTVPYYEDLTAYLRTIARVAQLDFRTLVPSHLPPMDRKVALKFLEDSLSFVLRFETEVRSRLKKARHPMTSLELWHSMDKLWDQYPADLGMYMLLEEHLEGLLQRGLASGTLVSSLTWVGPDLDEVAALIEEARLVIQEVRH